MSRVETRLQDRGLILPRPPRPIASFEPYRITGPLVFLAGQVCERNGPVEYVGKVGREFDLATAQRAAQLCALNLLACLRLACNGDLERVVGCVRVGGFVNCDPEFDAVPAVINGASDLLIDLFGDAGRHARTAVGVASLPRRAAVEVDAVFEIGPP